MNQTSSGDTQAPPPVGPKEARHSADSLAPPLYPEMPLPTWLSDSLWLPVTGPNFENLSSTILITSPAPPIRDAAECSALFRTVLSIHRRFGPSGLEDTESPQVNTFIVRDDHVSRIRTFLLPTKDRFCTFHDTFAKPPPSLLSHVPRASRRFFALIGCGLAVLSCLVALALLFLGPVPRVTAGPVPPVTAESSSIPTSLGQSFLPDRGPPPNPASSGLKDYFTYPMSAANLVLRLPPLPWSVMVSVVWLGLYCTFTASFQWFAWGSWSYYRHWSRLSVWPLISFGFFLGVGVALNLGLWKFFFGLLAAGLSLLIISPLASREYTPLVVLLRRAPFRLLPLGLTAFALGLGLFDYREVFGNQLAPLPSHAIQRPSIPSFAGALFLILPYTRSAFRGARKNAHPHIPPLPSVALKDEDFSAMHKACKDIAALLPRP